MTECDYSLYIIRCADGSLYTGIAIDVARRIKEHESDSRGAKYLRGKGPLQLEYQERIGNRSAASRAEYRVKNLRRSAKESLVAGRMTLAELTIQTDRHQASGVAGG
jgi:putative endonuclease